MARISVRPPPGIISDSTPRAAAGHWGDGSNVRFDDDGNAEVLKGWSAVTASTLTGVCRAAFPWTDNTNALLLAFGTHSKLQLFASATLYDITPTLQIPSFTFATDPFAVTNLSSTVTATHAAHGRSVGDTVVIAGSNPVGRVVINGTRTVASVPSVNTYTFAAGSNAATAKTLGSYPLACTNGSKVIVVTDTGHNLYSGQSVTISGALDTDGVGATSGCVLNGTYAITVINGNSWSYSQANNATNTGTKNFGATAVVTTIASTGGGAAATENQPAYSAGLADASGAAYLRTWATAAYGQTLLASYRGGTVYQWSNDTATVAAPLQNAPQKITYMLVAQTRQVFALGCSQEADAVFNPLTIRHSSTGNLTEWNSSSATTAREYTLPGGGRIVAGRTIADRIAIWTSDALFIGRYTASTNPAPWAFDRVGRGCGLMGPNAAVVINQTAYWVGANKQFYTYELGGEPQVVPCPVWNDFAANVVTAQTDKIVVSSIAEQSEVRVDYPDSRDGTENSRYVAVKVTGPTAGSWYRGIMARTAMVDSGASAHPIGVTSGGAIYYHENGNSADGSALSWYIETADAPLSDNDTLLLTKWLPDIKDQVGSVAMTITGSFKPNGAAVTKGPYTALTTDAKVDIRAKGKFFKVKLSGNATATGGRLGVQLFDAQASAGR